MTTIKLNQQLKRVEIADLEIANEIVFSYFESIAMKDREDALFRAIYMGVLALMEDRLASFLAKTESELGVRLEGLKQIFEMKKEIFYKSAIKGTAAEEDTFSFLSEFLRRRGWNDELLSTGSSSGILPRNKTGDIVSKIERRDDRRIAIECKFDKAIRLGDLDTRDISARRTDTVWSQLVESSANRLAAVSIVVMDKALVDAGVLAQVESVAYLQNVGFVVIVDSQSGDYANLGIAYGLARDLVLGAIQRDANPAILVLLVRRLLSDMDNYLSIRRSVEQIVSTSHSILLQLSKSLLMMQFTDDYLKKFLAEGTLSSSDLLDYYMAEDVRLKYAVIERDVLELANRARE